MYTNEEYENECDNQDLTDKQIEELQIDAARQSAIADDEAALERALNDMRNNESHVERYIQRWKEDDERRVDTGEGCHDK